MWLLIFQHGSLKTPSVIAVLKDLLLESVAKLSGSKGEKKIYNTFDADIWETQISKLSNMHLIDFTLLLFLAF